MAPAAAGLGQDDDSSSWESGSSGGGCLFLLLPRRLWHKRMSADAKAEAAAARRTSSATSRRLMADAGWVLEFQGAKLACVELATKLANMNMNMSFHSIRRWLEGEWKEYLLYLLLEWKKQ